jgi:hypothetical protein
MFVRLPESIRLKRKKPFFSIDVQGPISSLEILKYSYDQLINVCDLNKVNIYIQGKVKEHTRKKSHIRKKLKNLILQAKEMSIILCLLQEFIMK